MNRLKVCILGYGGIARSHRKGYELLESKGNSPVELVALCDIDEKQFENVVSINNAEDSGSQKTYNTYTDLDKMLEIEKPDIIDICLPTYLHCEYASKLLLAGFNVQCEKPMGLNTKECETILEVQRKSGKHLFIGMCLRFDSYYLELKKMIDDGRFGKVNAAFFKRESQLPRWGYDGWFHDYDRCGGVAMDLHIHDVDMIRFLFGEPKSVSSVTVDAEVKCRTITTNFCYDDMLVNAIGDWGFANSWKFHSGYRVNFEKATVICEKGVITVYPEDNEPYEHKFDKNNHMAEEIEYFANTILGNFTNTVSTPESAAKTVELIETIIESADNNGALKEVK